MTDFYLRFNTKEEADSVLYTVTPQVTDEEGTVVVEESTKPNFANIDIIGTIYNADAVLGEDGEVITEATAKDGYHVNVRVIDEDASALELFSVVPNQPMRVWG